MAGAGLNRPDPDPAPAQAGRGARLGGAICRHLARPPGNGGAVTNLKSAAGKDACDTAPKPRGSGAGLPRSPISDCVRGVTRRPRRFAAASATGYLRERSAPAAPQAGVPPPVRPRGFDEVAAEHCNSECRRALFMPRRTEAARTRMPRTRLNPDPLPRGMPSRRRRCIAPDRQQRNGWGIFVRGVSGRAQYRICRGAIRCVCTFFCTWAFSGPSVTAPSPGADPNDAGGRCPTAVMRPCARYARPRGAVARKRGPALPVPRAIVGRVPRFSARCPEPSRSRFK